MIESNKMLDAVSNAKVYLSRIEEIEQLLSKELKDKKYGKIVLDCDRYTFMTPLKVWIYTTEEYRVNIGRLIMTMFGKVTPRKIPGITEWSFDYHTNLNDNKDWNVEIRLRIP